VAVVVRFMCTRDGAMFEDRKQAVAHDRMLESVERLRELIEASAIKGVSEELADQLAYYLVQNKDKTLGALKGAGAASESASAEGEAAADDAAPEEEAESEAEPKGGRKRKGRVA